MERHQLFVIARVGTSYRCLAAVQHQWLSDMSAISRCLYLLDIFSNEKNRLPIVQELRNAVEYFKSAGPPPEEPPHAEYEVTGPCPFPFIATGLVLGSSYNPFIYAVEVIREASIHLGFDQSDNDTGVTVLDITDPSTPKYCFIKTVEDLDHPDGKHSGSYCHPLKASQYLDAFPEYGDARNEAALELIDKLDNHPLISLAALEETWHWGDWHVNKSAESLLQNPSNGPKGLVEQSVETLVEAILGPASGTIIDEQTRRLPNFQSILKQSLVAKGELVGQSAGSVHLLTLAYDNEVTLDWGMFTNITLEVLQASLQSPGLQAAKCINIPGFAPAASSSMLLDALAPLHHLEEIVIMDRASRESDRPNSEIYMDLSRREDGPRIQRFVLSGLYSSAIRQAPSHPTSAAPLVNPSFPITQLLILGDSDPAQMSTTPPLEQFFLGDAAISPVRFVNGLLRLMQCLDSELMNQSRGVTVATCMAAASSSFTVSGSGELNPLPAEMYRLGIDRFYSPVQDEKIYSKLRNLSTGQWTVLLGRQNTLNWAHLRNGRPVVEEGFRYAFVRAKANVPLETYADPSAAAEKIEVLSIEGFLKELDASLDGLEETLQAMQYKTRVGHMDPIALRCMSKGEAGIMLAAFVANQLRGAQK